MAAAFGRLCVETKDEVIRRLTLMTQPPSGGCVLKHWMTSNLPHGCVQPPSGGCVLKQAYL